MLAVVIKNGIVLRNRNRSLLYCHLDLDCARKVVLVAVRSICRDNRLVTDSAKIGYTPGPGSLKIVRKHKLVKSVKVFNGLLFNDCLSICCSIYSHSSCDSSTEIVFTLGNSDNDLVLACIQNGVYRRTVLIISNGESTVGIISSNA